MILASRRPLGRAQLEIRFRGVTGGEEGGGAGAGPGPAGVPGRAGVSESS